MYRSILNEIEDVEVGQIIFAVSKVREHTMLAKVIDENTICSYCNIEFQDELWDIKVSGVNKWYIYEVNDEILDYISSPSIHWGHLANYKGQLAVNNLCITYLPATNKVLAFKYSSKLRTTDIISIDYYVDESYCLEVTKVLKYI